MQRRLAAEPDSCHVKNISSMRSLKKSHHRFHFTVCFVPGWLHANINCPWKNNLRLILCGAVCWEGFCITPPRPGPKLWMHTNIRPDKVVKDERCPKHPALPAWACANSSFQGYLCLAHYQDRRHPVESQNNSFTSPGFSLSWGP